VSKLYNRLINSQLFKSGEWFTSRDMVTYIHANKTDVELYLRELIDSGRAESVRDRKGGISFTRYRSRLLNREYVNKRFSKGPTISYGEAHINPWIYHDIKRSEYTKATCS